MNKIDVSLATIRSIIKKGWLTEKKEEVYRDPYKHRTFQRTEPLQLTMTAS